MCILCIDGDEIEFDQCGKTKGCFFGPDNCNSEVTCKYLLTFREIAGNKIQFEMSGRTEYTARSSYIAVGFSKDKEMGDDSVIACVRDINTGEINIYASYNEIYRNNVRFDLEAEEAGVDLQDTSYDNRIIKCRFTRDIKVRANVRGQEKWYKDRIFDLDKQYYIFMANGPATANSIQRHDLRVLPLISRGKLKMTYLRDERKKPDQRPVDPLDRRNEVQADAEAEAEAEPKDTGSNLYQSFAMKIVGLVTCFFMLFKFL